MQKIQNLETKCVTTSPGLPYFKELKKKSSDVEKILIYHVDREKNYVPRKVKV